MTPPSDLNVVLKGARNRPLDAAFASDLARRQAAYPKGTGPAIGRFALTVDGREFEDLYAAVLDPTARFERVELLLNEAVPPGPAWEFLKPFQRLVLESDGSADLYPRWGLVEHSIARVLTREGFGTPPSGPEFGWGRLPSLPQFARALRSGGYVAFGVALELYGSHARTRYELDLLGSRILADPRSGRRAPSSRLRHPSRAAWTFDRLVSAANLAPTSARVLETIWETGAASEADLVRIFGEADGGAGTIGILARHRLIEADPDAGGWRVRPDPVGPVARAPSSSQAVREPQSALRHNMGELLAGAEARQTCPMCGEELPADHQGLLCERCTREVAGAS
ncbi:MAG: hypothetical protein L3J95_01320 [Thermoplasmata archaeon]|nr:hypothetical protein [Thermoplasmata archaeon]MCI4359055.1 hypothetical protein [Thermoplasmata archaeon]